MEYRPPQSGCVKSLGIPRKGNSMKGVIFRGFLEFVETEHGLAFVEEVLDATDLASGGAYTSIGQYPFAELVAMVSEVSRRQGQDLSDLLTQFGVFTFGHLVRTYPELVAAYDDALTCIHHVDQTIHKNVLKIHPDANLPQLNAEFDAEGRLNLDYRSTRPLSAFTHGLIQGCADHFETPLNIEMTLQGEPEGTQASFVLSHAAH